MCLQVLLELLRAFNSIFHTAGAAAVVYSTIALSTTSALRVSLNRVLSRCTNIMFFQVAGL